MTTKGLCPNWSILWIGGHFCLAISSFGVNMKCQFSKKCFCRHCNGELFHNNGSLTYDINLCLLHPHLQQSNTYPSSSIFCFYICVTWLNSIIIHKPCKTFLMQEIIQCTRLISMQSVNVINSSQQC